MQTITTDQIKLLKEGDKSIYKEMFRLYYARLVVFANKYTSDSMVAEDLVGDLFKHLWEKRKNLNIEGSFESFLFTSTKNKCLNYLRGLKVKDKAHQDLFLEQEDDLTFQNYLVEEEVHSKIWQAIRNLPEDLRRVFELNTIHQVKLPEIAEDLGISINTIKSQKKRALRLLREELGDAIYSILLVSF